MPVPLISDAPTLAHLLAERFDEGRERVAMHAQMPDGQFQAVTWRELQLSVDATVGVLLGLGVQPGDRVAQLSENRFEWVLLDFACLLLQAVHVPLHASLANTQALEQITHSGAKVLALSTCDQAAKLAKVANDWPTGLKVIGYAPCGDVIGAAWQGMLTELCQQTRTGASYEILRDYSGNIRPETLATLLYTSGTTGEPKGVMLSHQNLVSNASASAAAFGEQPEEVKLNFLPLSHVFARTCDLYAWLVRGGELVLSSSREKIVEECGRFHPTVINGVPYFFERLYRSLCERHLENTPGALAGLLGGKIRFCNSGGAALPPHLFDFFQQQGIPLLEGYGLTESSPVITLSSPSHFRRGAVGRAIEGVEVRIADDGEVLTRGPHVMLGYWQNDAATAEIIRAGWLHTGDLGRLDDDGFLFITGRKKELIVLSSGKNIAPCYLESLLAADPLIAQALVVGDNRSYLSALIVPHVPNLREELSLTGRALPENRDWRGDELVLALYRQHLEQRLDHVSHHEQVRQFTLLAEPFSIERGELTPKLSQRREVIQQRYAAEIEAMYPRGECQ